MNTVVPRALHRYRGTSSINSSVRSIFASVYDLYALTDEEIEIVEDAVGD